MTAGRGKTLRHPRPALYGQKNRLSGDFGFWALLLLALPPSLTGPAVVKDGGTTSTSAIVPSWLCCSRNLSCNSARTRWGVTAVCFTVPTKQ